MNLLRSLISLEIEAPKDTCVDIHGTEQYQSAELIRPKQLPQLNKTSKLFAYSSMNIAKHQKHLHTKKEQKKHEEHQTEFEQKQETSLHLEVNESFANLTLPSHYDLNLNISLASISSASCTSNMQLTLSGSSYTLSDNILHYHDIEQHVRDIEMRIFPSNDFRFMYNIGHGAFGIVHKDFHIKSCQVVAIKQCRSTNCKSFKKEIQIYKKCAECKYIINMIEYGIIEKENKICIALEYMNMSSLNLNKYRFNQKQITYICTCLLKALCFLHIKLYIHNDLKPDNILFNDNWDIKLTDFGCVTQMKDINIPLTETSGLGTEYYQSFEKRFVTPVEYTTKSDIYSFGITICELLSQKQIINKDVVLPFEIPKEICCANKDLQLTDFLNKCLDRNYKQRWSAEQLLKHSFLNNDYKDMNENKEMDKLEDMDDLEFMTNTLIDYYSHFKNKNKNKNNISVISYTPIDNIWSDADRIQNMAKSSGFSVQFVQDFIAQEVRNMKNKYLKL